MRRAAALAAVLLVLAVPVVRAGAAPSAVGAQTDAPATSLELVAQDAWSAVGTMLRLDLRVPPALAVPDASIILAAYQPVTTRAAFDRIAAGASPSSVLDQAVVPLGALADDATGVRSLTIGLEGPGAARGEGTLSLRRPGVYPLVVELRDGDDRVRSAFTTMAVVVGAAGDGTPTPLPARLGVAWVWPLESGPSTLPDGSDDPAVTAEFAPTGRLGRQAAALNRAGDVPLTLAPGPETLEAWLAQGREDPEVARGAAAVLDAAGRSQVIAGGYVPTNLPSLLAGDLTIAADRELTRGSDTLAVLIASPVDATTALARPVDGASLGHLQGRGVTHVIVDDTAVAAPSARVTTRPFSLQSPPSLVPTGPAQAVATDTGLARLLEGDRSPALQAQLVLAGLSVIAQQAPDTRRAVVLTNPAGLDAPASLLDAVLAGLRGHPWLEPETVADVFANVPSDATHELVASTPAAPPVGALVWTGTDNRLASFRSLAGADDPVAVGGERSLLTSLSATFVGPAGELRARATVGSVDAAINRFLADIRVPRPSTITLTSRAGEIPLTFRNDTGKDIDVVIELASPKLFFPEGSLQRVTLPPKSTTIRFAVEARTSGTFPLRLSVRSADGGLAIADTRFRVRSTVVSGVGLALMAGAAVFLVIWWALHFRRGRRNLRAEIEHP